MANQSLDIIIPTYNRSALLPRCVGSVFDASPPDAMPWRVHVIDNNSSDPTRQTCESLIARYGERVRYHFAEKRGKSAALNHAIRNTAAELLGFIDDDERVGRDWLRVIERHLQDADISYVGGAYLGDWMRPTPEWYPPSYCGAIGADAPERLPKEPCGFENHDLFLHGGNAVIRRKVFDRIGLYSEQLGRRGSRLGSCEDHDMFARLKDSGTKGLYVPDLIIHHLIPEERLTKQYFRRWAWDRAISLSLMDKVGEDHVVRWGKIPRYLVGHTLRGSRWFVRGSASERFGAELDWIALVGLLWGLYFRRKEPV